MDLPTAALSPAELESATVAPLALSHLAPPGPALQPFPAPVPNYQDLSDSSTDDDDRNSQDWDALVAAAEAAFSKSDIAEMQEYLRERGLFAFMNEYLDRRSIPPSTLLLAFGVMVRPDTPFLDQLRMLKIACSRVLRNREKLEQYNTPEDVVALIRKSKRILILTGAGVSTSCGIPDFRSPTGLYARLQLENNYDLDDPQDMFDLAYFRRKPHVFYSFAKEIYPSNFVPSPCHRFVRLLELEGKLLRNYTQNIDGLFEQVGVERMLNCHGSFATASCLLCRRRFPGHAIESDVFASRVPLCPYCTPELDALAEQARRDKEKKDEAERPRKKKKTGRAEWEGEEGESEGEEDEAREIERSEWEGKALLKPDIVFFGEALSDEFDHKLLADREEVDLVIVMGTSMRVSPVAQLPSHLPHSVPQILINRDPVTHHQFDVCLLGDGDGIVRWLCAQLERGEGDAAGARDERWDLDSRVPVQLPTHELPPAAAAAAAAAHAAESASASASQPVEPAASSSSSAVAAPLLPPVGPSIPSLPASAHPPQTATAGVRPEQVGQSHVWLFPGADREGRWVSAVRRAYAESSEGEEEEEGEQAVGETAKAEDDEDERPVELPASLAPGVKEGGFSPVPGTADDEVNGKLDVGSAGGVDGVGEDEWE
ncbi:hypothetical protein Rhopal_003065-T1 [Rhodotorula paludigena]|uniref:Deacetylase sirtuin-type domain-containing protein n=1 Tax=Rhodotorula paludigena TaxID=86838 RepID=A0AAV5GM02_9BASI|nr:hypothetical protein Rhopal_003065-T1 [Rhodotorula paludigena]